jgi:hypothetical protein
MLPLRGKGPKSLYTILTLIILLFGRKKPAAIEEPPPKPAEPFPIPEILRKTVTTGDLGKARDRLRIASLERDIIGNALTTIYEAEAKGQLSEPERNQLTQRYKNDLKRVDGEIDTNKKVVDLHELESAKEDLLKSFHEKLMEIDLRINQIKPSLTSLPSGEDIKVKPAPVLSKPETEPSPAQAVQNKEKPKEKPKNKAEERLEAIREEVLKAMERLEQIETEG